MSSDCGLFVKTLSSLKTWNPVHQDFLVQDPSSLLQHRQLLSPSKIARKLCRHAREQHPPRLHFGPSLSPRFHPEAWDALLSAHQGSAQPQLASQEPNIPTSISLLPHPPSSFTGNWKGFLIPLSAQQNFLSTPLSPLVKSRLVLVVRLWWLQRTNPNQQAENTLGSTLWVLPLSGAV